jgi:hypothetical protein
MADFPVGPSRDLFRSRWMRRARFANAHIASFIFLELHHHARYLDAESRALEQRMLDTFTAIVVSAQTRRELRPGPPRLLMGVVMGAFIGVVRSCMEYEQERIPTDQEWAFAEQCAWEAIRV